MSLIDSFTSFQLGILDKLIPEPEKLPADQLRRARLLVGILFYSLVLSIILLIFRYQNAGLAPSTVSTILTTSFVIGLIITYKATSKLNVICDITIALLLLSITLIAYNEGGLTSRATIWLPIFPLITQSIGHKLKAKSMVVIIICILIFLYFFENPSNITNNQTSQSIFARALTITMVTFFVTIVTLIYDNSRRLLEEQLIIEKENAEQAFKLKSEFLANMSHELRTPFNGVLGMLELLSNSSLTDQQQHRVGLAKNSAESLLLLINDILDFSKIEAGKQDIECIDFNAETLFGNIAEAMAFSANPKGVEVILDTHGLQQANFKGDPNRLRQVTTNLISNAIKFTSKGDVIITLHSQKNNDTHTLTVSIKDSGIGIPKDKIAILFESFTQVDASTSRKYGGSGLGLTIAKKLSELMGGNLTVSSEDGKGSTFTFTAELKQPENNTQQALPNIENKHIVIIDDNQHVLSVFKNRLLNSKAIVKTFSQSDPAIEYIKNESDNNIDLILIDTNMPNTNGIEISKKLKSMNHLAHIKIVLMSDTNTLDNEKMIDDIGVDGSFSKPITFNDLYKTLSLISNTQPESPTKPHNIEQPSPETAEQTRVETHIRMLVVDDSAINLEVAAALLDSFDIRPILASSAKEAFTILSQHPKKGFIHGILMDCQMPDMDGFEATRAIRAGKTGDAYKSIPIIALTANAMKGDKEKCLTAGMDDYLTKPININQLITAIDRFVSPNK